MKAIVSGQSATAIYIENDKIYSISLNSPETWVEKNKSDIPFLFAEAEDIFELENVSKSQVLEKLKIAWAQDRSLHLILILLDSEEDPQNRLEAAECLNDFLIQKDVKVYVENRLYSSPVPSSSDLNGAIKLSLESSFSHVTEFLRTLLSEQDEISKRVQAWESLPMSLFGDLAGKQEFYHEAVRYGAFYQFVAERQKKDLALLNLLSHPHFRGRTIARKIFQTWAAPFKESAINIEFGDYKIDDNYEESESIQRRRALSGFEIFHQVEKQKDSIKKLLKEGKQDLALKFTNELITSQRLNSEPVHRAKTLCDLAQFAKELGSPELHLKFALRAVEEVPDDAWAHATLGDAYRSVYEFQKAQDAYHNAGNLGSIRVALIGRAEVLKDIGQLKDALDIFDRCSKEFPEDSVSRNSRAAALAHYGKFQQALNAYDEILLEEPFSLVARSGRAQVLREMGHLEEALTIFNELADNYPGEIIQQHACAEVLRELGELNKAQIAFKNLINLFPLAAHARTGYAKILRDLGRFDQALEEYRNVIKEFPLNISGYIGIAETYKKIGNLKEALESYDYLIGNFPRSSVARNGKASVLVAMGDYSNAIRFLSTTTDLPSTQIEWIAFHIQGMAQMRSGDLTKAEKTFEWGLKENPWISQLGYFKTALASVRIQQKRYQDVNPLVSNILHPSIQPIASTLIMHASGEMGNMSQFDQYYLTIQNSSAPVVLELREALSKRYKRNSSSVPSDLWLFNRECDSLLLAA